MTHLGRREFIGLFGGAAAWPLCAYGQQTGTPVLGFVSNRSAAESAYLVSAFQEGLKETGYAAGRNLTIEYRWGEGQYERATEATAEFVRHHVSAIIAVGGIEKLVIEVAREVPVVFVSGGDPVALGLVSSLNRPTGNATGTTVFAFELEQKRLEILTELLPDADTLVAVVNPSDPSADRQTTELSDAAHRLRRSIHIVHARNEDELEGAFAAAKQKGARGVQVSANAFFNSRRNRIVALAARHSLPALYHVREFPVAGGLMSYGPSIPAAYRLAGIYAGRILSGSRPSELPVTLPTKFDLIINLTTAKALGIEIPPTLLARADEVIE